jgi:hypothetical protein
LLKANTGKSTYIFGAAIILFLVGVLTYALLSNNFSPNPVSPLVLTATSTPSLVTNTPRFTATTTRVTPTLIYTSTPTPDYENFEPRLAPEDEKDFLFYDDFTDDLHNWHIIDKNNTYVVEVKKAFLKPNFCLVTQVIHS